MKQSPSPSPEPSLVMYRNVRNVEKRNGDIGNDIAAASSETTELESMKKQLKEMRDLLEAQLHRGEQRHEDDTENEMKNDWILAAAVVDRICAIVVSILFVVGTVVLFVLFAEHPSSPLSPSTSASSSSSSSSSTSSPSSPLSSWSTPPPFRGPEGETGPPPPNV